VYGEVKYGNVPGAVTSILFIALGASLSLMHSRRIIAFAQIIAVGTLLFSILVLLTNLSGSAFLQELFPSKGGISERTALAFLLLSGGILYLRPNEGLVARLIYSATGRFMVRELLVPAVAGPILLGIILTATVRVSALGFDDTFIIWLIVWGTITILVIVIWRFAYRLSEQESRRRRAEKERDEAMAALRLADERKDVFLATVAHELRNPLSAIDTGASLLTMTQTPNYDQVRCTAELICRQVSQMAHLVDDLMDVSRVVAGIVVLNKQELDLRQVISDALEQVQPLFASRGHVLRAGLPAESLLVEGDRNKLLQVFGNLLSNAARYTPDGGNVLINAVVLGSNVVVSVRDDGIGIDPDLLPDMFDLFMQAKRKSDRSQGGLGLGLALVKSLVELHGGEVSGHSEGLGKGSVFTVVLPKMPNRSEEQ
jgi:signal transduction histidine kinase